MLTDYDTLVISRVWLMPKHVVYKYLAMRLCEPPLKCRKGGQEVNRRVRLRLADNRVVESPVSEVGIGIEGYRASVTPVVFGAQVSIYLEASRWSS